MKRKLYAILAVGALLAGGTYATVSAVTAGTYSDVKEPAEPVLKAVPNVSEMKFDLTVEVPSTYTDGSAITGTITKVEVNYLEEDWDTGYTRYSAGVKENVTPGATLNFEYSDEYLWEGQECMFEAVVTCGTKTSYVQITAKLAEPKPAQVQNFNYKCDGSKVIFTWDPVTTMDDGSTIDGAVTYSLAEWDSSKFESIPIVSDLTDCTYTHDTGLTEQTQKSYQIWAVAKGIVGVKYMLFGANVGPEPVESLPYIESFAEYRTLKQWDNKDLNESWNSPSYEEADVETDGDPTTAIVRYAVQGAGDAMMYCYPNNNIYYSLTSASKIDLTGAADPNLYYAVYNFPIEVGTSGDADEYGVSLYIAGNDGEFTKVAYTGMDADKPEGWNQYKVSLANYAGQQVKVKVVARWHNSQRPLMVDEIEVADGASQMAKYFPTVDPSIYPDRAKFTTKYNRQAGSITVEAVMPTVGYDVNDNIVNMSLIGMVEIVRSEVSDDNGGVMPLTNRIVSSGSYFGDVLETYNNVKPGSTIVYEDTNVEKGKKYTYNVLVYNSDENVSYDWYGVTQLAGMQVAAPEVASTFDYDGCTITLNVTAPSTFANDEELDIDLTKIEVYCYDYEIWDSVLVETIENPVKGQTYQFVDKNLQQDQNYEYQVIAYTADGPSESVFHYVSFFAPKPTMPENVKVTRDGANVTLTWDPVTELTDGNPITGDVTYIIQYKKQSDYLSDYVIIADNITDTTYTFDSGLTEELEVYIQVFAVAGNLKSEGAFVATTIGPKPGAYELPVIETFTYGEQLKWDAVDLTDMWNYPYATESFGWHEGEDETWVEEYGVGGQGDYLLHADPLQDFNVQYTLARSISLAGAADPTVSFYVYNFPDFENVPADEGVTIYVAEAGSDEFVKVGKTVNFTTQELRGWTKYSFSLAQFKDKEIDLRYNIKWNQAQQFCFDNISVTAINEDSPIEPITEDVNPEKAEVLSLDYAPETSTFYASVLMPAEGFVFTADGFETVELTSIEKAVVRYSVGFDVTRKDLAVIENPAPGEVVKVEEVLDTPFTEGNKYQIFVEVYTTDKLYSSTNGIFMTAGKFNPVEDLKAELSEDQKEVTLSWTHEADAYQTHLGFNVYVDGVKVNAEPIVIEKEVVDEPTTDENEGGEATPYEATADDEDEDEVEEPVVIRLSHTLASELEENVLKSSSYQVTAVYLGGESALSDAVMIETNSVDLVEIDNIRVENGVLYIDNAAGARVLVFAVNGVVVCDTCDAQIAVALEKGTYVVVSGKKSYKIMVK